MPRRDRFEVCLYIPSQNKSECVARVVYPPPNTDHACPQHRSGKGSALLYNATMDAIAHLVILVIKKISTHSIYSHYCGF